MKQKIKILSMFIVYISLNIFVFFHKVQSHKSNIKINDKEYFAEYSNGYIYIGNDEYINKLGESVNDCDVLVIDSRDGVDPNMKILNSYQITDKDNIKDIIHILKLYEEMYPTDWNRSEESMYNEWIIHNILYSFNYNLSRTTDVDFNNEDENLYKILRLK